MAPVFGSGTVFLGLNDEVGFVGKPDDTSGATSAVVFQIVFFTSGVIDVCSLTKTWVTDELGSDDYVQF